MVSKKFYKIIDTMYQNEVALDKMLDELYTRLDDLRQDVKLLKDREIQKKGE